MLIKIIGILLFFCSFGVLANDTILKLYRPYGDVNEQVVPQIKKTFLGSCDAQSELIIREDAWRCTAQDKTYDPCFVKAGPNRTEALCPKSPWNGDSVLIRVNTPLSNEQNKPLDMSRAYPWGVELANGEHCQIIATDEFYDQMPVRYLCTQNNYLVGHLQRCKTQWSMLKKTPHGVVNVSLSKAWF